MNEVTQKPCKHSHQCSIQASILKARIQKAQAELDKLHWPAKQPQIQKHKASLNV